MTIVFGFSALGTRLSCPLLRTKTERTHPRPPRWETSGSLVVTEVKGSPESQRSSVVEWSMGLLATGTKGKDGGRIPESEGLSRYLHGKNSLETLVTTTRKTL